MPKEYDPYETGSGLPDDFDGVMTHCAFEYRTVEYQEEEVLSFTTTLTYLNDDGDPAEWKITAGVGKGWESRDRGKTIQAIDGGKKKVHKQTYYGLLIDAALQTDVPLREIGKEVEGGAELGPLRAALFEGLEFHWKSKKVSYGGEIGEMDRLLPTEYVGRKGSKTKAKSEAGQGEAASNGRLTAVLGKKLSAAAEAVLKDGGDHDAFLARAVEIDGVMDNRAAEDAISETGPESIWGKALAAAE